MKLKIAIPRVKIVRYEYSRINVIPNKYGEFLIDMNYICANFNGNFLHGRDKEIRRIYISLLKRTNPNVMLLGKNGVGKTSIIQSMIYKVLNKECPEEFRNFHFIYFNVEKILISLPEKNLSRLLSEILEFLSSHNNLVIVIDQVHLIALSIGLKYFFGEMLKSPSIKVIGMATTDDFYDYFEYDSKVRSQLDIINILEPKNSQISDMIGEYVKLIGKRDKVVFPKKLIDYTASVSAAFSAEICNPGLTVELIEKSIIVAKLNKHKRVTKRDINSNFNFNFDLYSKMSEDDKKITAYHEAGHFIVSKMSPNIKNIKTTAITIIPAEDFLGVTMFEFEPENQTSLDSDYFIDNIATDLAGRVAETILQGKGKDSKLTSGSYSDLKNATQTARRVITEYGMIESCGKNMTYFCNYDLSDLALLSEERKILIDRETEKLINIAYERAKTILNQNQILLDLIANELLNNEVLDENDLNRLCKIAASKT